MNKNQRKVPKKVTKLKRVGGGTLGPYSIPTNYSREPDIGPTTHKRYKWNLTARKNRVASLFGRFP